MGLESGTNKIKIICNAEPFGFGPASAIAQIAHELRPHIDKLGYIGEGHTLELQNEDVYDEIIDITNKADEKNIKRRISDYDIVLTAMDFNIAAIAIRAGKRVIVYDALAWYWKKMPEIIKDIDLYIAQDFIGVMNRVVLEAKHLPRTIIVPPIVRKVEQIHFQKRAGIVVNFGGISNPIWGDDVGSQYVSIIAPAFGSHRNETTCIGSSKFKNACESALHDSTYKNVSAQTAITLMSNAKITCVTPGLGNIFEVSATNTPAIFLPPANDSQGMQMNLLKKYGYSDACIDWHEITGMQPIDYAADQTDVLNKIKNSISQIHADKKLREKLKIAISSRMERQLHSNENIYPQIQRLTKDFGYGGATQIRGAIVNYISEKGNKRKISQSVKPDDREVLTLQGYTVISNWDLHQEKQGNKQIIVGDLDLIDEHGKKVSARFKKGTDSQTTPPNDAIESLMKAGFKYFAHTTRPENIKSIFEMKKIVTGNALQQVQFGDPLGRHDHILGQLMKGDAKTGDTKNLLERTGYRTPILLFSLDKVLYDSFHLSKGYPFGHYVTFETSDGNFFPSFRVDGDQSLHELLKDPLFHDAHEVILKQKEIDIDLLDWIIIASDSKHIIKDIPQKYHSKIRMCDSLPRLDFLRDIPQYSQNSFDIVHHSLTNRNLSHRELTQLFLREFPSIANKIENNDKNVMSKINAIRRIKK